MLCTLSGLNKQDIEQIQSLENELNQSLLAFSCHEIQPAVLAADKLARIQSLEEKLGISLIAVQSNN